MNRKFWLHGRRGLGSDVPLVKSVVCARMLRQGDLGAIDEKYDVAVSTACGALDHIVVDTINTAQQCVEYLKQHGVGVATFIGLDKMERWKTVCRKPFTAYVIVCKDVFALGVFFQLFCFFCHWSFLFVANLSVSPMSVSVSLSTSIRIASHYCTVPLMLKQMRLKYATKAGDAEIWIAQVIAKCIPGSRTNHSERM